jgi:hypothetical protein
MAGGGLTSLGAAQVLNFYLRGIVPTLPGTMYLRLLTTPSTKTSSGTETTYGSYARLALVRGTSLFTDPLLTSRSTNVAEFAFPAPSSPDDDIVAFDFVNTSSGAFTETYLFGNVQPHRSIIVGTRLLKFPAGALVVTA